MAKVSCPCIRKSCNSRLLVLIVWIAVCLVPFFNQFEFLGLKLKAQIVKATEASFGYEVKSVKSTAIDPNIMYLFETRYQIESGLRNLTRLSDLNIERRLLPLTKIIYHLVENELLPSELGGVAREVYSICSPAMHRDIHKVSENQIEFIKKVSPELITVINSAVQKFV